MVARTTETIGEACNILFPIQTCQELRILLLEATIPQALGLATRIGAAIAASMTMRRLDLCRLCKHHFPTSISRRRRRIGGDTAAMVQHPPMASPRALGHVG